MTMRTTLNVDDSIIKDLVRFTKAKTRTEAVNKGLKEFVRRKRIEQLKNLSGKIEIEDNWRLLEKLENEESHN